MAIKMRKKQKNKVQAVVKKATSPAVSANTAASSGVQPVFNIPKTKYVEATGRRKVATSRVRLYHGEGDFVVNNQAAGQYFGSIRNSAVLYMKPLELTGMKGKVAVTATVSGSGIHAQLQAVVHGLSRALAAHNPELRIFLKSAGLLTRDDRMKETRKVGMGGKARRKRQSPKR